MIFRICEFLISSVKTSPAGTNGFAAATVSVFAGAAVAAVGAGGAALFTPTP
ncbi:hypothetical protein D3C80_2092380 [compost metagenome]